MEIRPVTPRDHAAVHALNQHAFGQDGEARLVAALRAAGQAEVELVAVVDDRVVGHILFSGLAIEAAGGIVRALALAPMSVLPERQRAGIGSALVRAGIDRCRELAHRIVIVVGHVAYYPRFGFSAELAAPLASEYAGPHCMALELEPGALRGVRGRLRYAPAFQSL